MQSVPTQELCPACKAHQNPNRLSKSLATGEFFCTDPKNGKALHTFKDYEMVEAFDPALAFLEAKTSAEAAPVETPKPAVEAAVEAPIAKAAVLDATPKAMDPTPPEIPATEKRSEEATAITPAIGSVLKDRRAEEIPNIVPPKPVKFVPPPARKVAGGDLIVTVRIPERHINYLEGAAVAAGLNETVSQFVQREMERAMDDRWFY